MSAPDSDPGKQAWQHRGPLLGIALAVFVGVLMLLWWLFDETSQAENPVEDATAVPADVETAPELPAGSATDPTPPVTDPPTTGETQPDVAPTEPVAPQTAPSTAPNP